MSFQDRATHFMGREIVDYNPEQGIRDARAPQRIALSWEDENVPMVDLLERFLSDPAVGDVEALVFGIWSLDSQVGADDLVGRLAAAAGQLGSLRGLFLGDIPYEEQECSWIIQTDLTPLLAAFPQLRVLRSRGSIGLAIEPLRHGSLEELAIEGGGLPREVVLHLHESNLPSLRHLELWVGTEEYGRSTSVDDLRPLLTGNRITTLEHLALCNSEIAGETVALIADAGVPDSVKTLNLSKGTLSDEEARPLLEARERLEQLAHIDLSENFLSPAMLEELRAAGLPIVSTEQRDAEEYDGEVWRYVVVGE